MILFGLGQRDPDDILYFERAWPKLSPTPDVKAEFSKSAVTVRIYLGLICGFFCVSFCTIDKVSASANAYELNLERPKITAFNDLENLYLDRKGTPQSLD